MKYFTPELLARYRSDDASVADAADAEWEQELSQYNEHLTGIRSKLPEPVLQILDELLLHDATVLDMASHGSDLIIVLRKGIPPQDDVTLTYTLLAEPTINMEALPAEQRCPVMEFMYDEFDLADVAGKKSYTHSMLFSNGWEVELRFSELRLVLARPIYPLPSQSGGVLQSA